MRIPHAFLAISILVMLFISCSKDDNEHDVLVGTCWSNNTYKKVLYFKSGGRCEEDSYLRLDGSPTVYEVSYSVSGDNVTITDATGVYAKGTFTDKVLTITFTSDNHTWAFNKGR